MSYRVLQNGKRCSEYNIGDWNVDTFDTKEEAETFSYMWAYPISKDEAESMKSGMDIGVDYVFDFGVIMTIIETIESTPENWDNRVLGADEKYVSVSNKTVHDYMK